MRTLSSQTNNDSLEGICSIIRATEAIHIQEIRILFREYQHYLDVDLGFQDFEDELASLPGDYRLPGGILLLAKVGNRIAGCVALRNLGKNICEMKRLYVRPGFRGLRIGKRLAEAVIEEAITIGYSHMRLDTLDSLTKAMQLYASLGFKRVPPYYPNPLQGVVYWELDLREHR